MVTNKVTVYAIKDGAVVRVQGSEARQVAGDTVTLVGRISQKREVLQSAGGQGLVVDGWEVPLVGNGWEESSRGRWSRPMHQGKPPVDEIREIAKLHEKHWVRYWGEDAYIENDYWRHDKFGFSRAALDWVKSQKAPLKTIRYDFDGPFDPNVSSIVGESRAAALTKVLPAILNDTTLESRVRCCFPGYPLATHSNSMRLSQRSVSEFPAATIYYDRPTGVFDKMEVRLVDHFLGFNEAWQLVPKLVYYSKGPTRYPSLNSYEGRPDSHIVIAQDWGNLTPPGLKKEPALTAGMYKDGGETVEKSRAEWLEEFDHLVFSQDENWQTLEDYRMARVQQKDTRNVAQRQYVARFLKNLNSGLAAAGYVPRTKNEKGAHSGLQLVAAEASR